MSVASSGPTAAEVGHLGLAYEYFAEATLIDLKDL